MIFIDSCKPMYCNRIKASFIKESDGDYHIISTVKYKRLSLIKKLQL